MHSHQHGDEAGKRDNVTKCAACGKQCRSRGGLKRHAQIHKTNTQCDNRTNISTTLFENCNDVPCHLCMRIFKSQAGPKSSMFGPQIEYLTG